jgi:predicted nucleic acid-binding protein
MNSSSTNLVYVDAAGWIALVNRRDSLHAQAVRIYRQLVQEQCQFITASVVLLEVGNWLSPVPLRGLAIDLIQRIEQSSRIEVVHLTSRALCKKLGIVQQSIRQGRGHD